MLFHRRVLKNALTLLDREIIDSELIMQWRLKCNFHSRGPLGTLSFHHRWGRAAGFPSPWAAMYWYGMCVESYEGVKLGGHNGSYQIDSDHIIWFFYTHLGSSFGANDHKYLWMRPQPTWLVPFLAEHWHPCFQQLSCLLHSQRLPKSISIVSEEHERRSPDVGLHPCVIHSY